MLSLTLVYNNGVKNINEVTIMKLYDADYIIRKNNEYEEMQIYNSPAEVKLRKMIEEATRLCKIQNEKCKLQKAKLEEKRKARLVSKMESTMGME